MATPSVLISLLAASPAAKKPNTLTSLLPMVVIFGAMWLLFLRPQQNRAKAQRALLSDLKQGDKIVAAGGIVGTIRRIDDTTISLQVADNVVLKVDRGSVSKKIEG